MIKDFYNEISLKELVTFYLILIAVYVALPAQLEMLKHVLSPVALATLAAIFVVSVREIVRS